MSSCLQSTDKLPQNLDSLEKVMWLYNVQFIITVMPIQPSCYVAGQIGLFKFEGKKWKHGNMEALEIGKINK